MQVQHYLFILLDHVFHLKLEFLMAVVESLNLFLHLPLLVFGIRNLQEWLHLGEQPPPRPVAQLQVALHIALDDSNGSELFHTFLVGPMENTCRQR